jgi:hypothetical protein
LSDLSVGLKGESLIDFALQAGGQDNITVELIQISNSPWKKSVFRSYNPRISNGSQSGIHGGIPMRILKWMVIALAILGLCFGGLYLYCKSNKNKEIKALETNISVAKQELKKMETEVTNAEGAFFQTETNKKNAEEALETSRKTLSSAVLGKSPEITNYRSAVKNAEVFLREKESEETSAKQILDSLKGALKMQKDHLQDLEHNFEIDRKAIIERSWYEFFKHNNQ